MINELMIAFTLGSETIYYTFLSPLSEYEMFNLEVNIMNFFKVCNWKLI